MDNSRDDLPIDFTTSKAGFEKPAAKKRKPSSPPSGDLAGKYPVLKAALSRQISCYDVEDDDTTIDIPPEMVNSNEDLGGATHEVRNGMSGAVKSFTSRPKSNLKKVSPVNAVRSPTPVNVVRSPTPVNRDTSDSDSSPIFRRRPVSKATIDQVLDKISAKNTKKDQETQCERRPYFQADLYPAFQAPLAPAISRPRATSTPNRPQCIRSPSPALVDHDPKTDGIGLFIGKYLLFFSSLWYILCSASSICHSTHFCLNQ